MAAIHNYAHFRDTPDIDELCPKCFNPALKKFILQRIDLTGGTDLGERVACTDCKIWITPVKEYT